MVENDDDNAEWADGGVDEQDVRRDSIASAMWEQYQSEHVNWGLSPPSGMQRGAQIFWGFLPLMEYRYECECFWTYLEIYCQISYQKLTAIC